MIQTQRKRYQLTFWQTADRTGAALHLEFDDRDEAERAFEASEAEGRYRVGIFFEWDKVRQDWTLLRRYP